MGKRTRRLRTVTTSGFSRVMRDLRRAVDAKHDAEGHYAAAYKTLPMGRVVEIPATIIGAAPGGREIRELAHDVAAPFDRTFLDFGMMDLGWARLAGALVSGEPGEIRATVWYATGGGTCSMLEVSGERYANGLPCIRFLDAPGREEWPAPVKGTYDTATVHGLLWMVFGSLAILEAVSVDIVQAAGPPRGHQAHGIPHYEVVIRRNGKRYEPTGRPTAHSDWSHQWEVRGHFKHFRRGAVFNANPTRRVRDADGNECVRVWCPPYVKGPEDKPLIPKRRVVRDA